jgi:hypothetical protein
LISRLSFSLSISLSSASNELQRHTQTYTASFGLCANFQTQARKRSVKTNNRRDKEHRSSICESAYVTRISIVFLASFSAIFLARRCTAFNSRPQDVIEDIAQKKTESWGDGGATKKRPQKQSSLSVCVSLSLSSSLLSFLSFFLRCTRTVLPCL